MRLRLGGRRRVRLTGVQFIFSLFLGSAAGIYIWKPEFDRRKKISDEELAAERQKTLADFDKQSDPAKVPMKTSVVMRNEEVGSARFSLKNILSELKNPSNSGTRIIKYLGVAFLGVGCYYKLVKPALADYKFRRDEQFANALFELEQKQKSQTSHS